MMDHPFLESFRVRVPRECSDPEIEDTISASYFGQLALGSLVSPPGSS